MEDDISLGMADTSASTPEHTADPEPSTSDYSDSGSSSDYSDSGSSWDTTSSDTSSWDATATDTTSDTSSWDTGSSDTTPTEDTSSDTGSSTTTSVEEVTGTGTTDFPLLDTLSQLPDPFDGQPRSPFVFDPDPTQPPPVPTIDAVVGDPTADARYWREQDGDMSCAVVAQASVIEAVTGQPVLEAVAAASLENWDWYDSVGGTDGDDLTRLLEMHGVPHWSGSGTAPELFDVLESGDKLLVTLDGGEIWNPVRDPATGMPVEQDPQQGHVVWVTGLDRDESGQWEVVINDSGDPNGQGARVPLEDFINAWQDYGSRMITVGGHWTPASPEVSP